MVHKPHKTVAPTVLEKTLFSRLGRGGGLDVGGGGVQLVPTQTPHFRQSEAYFQDRRDEGVRRRSPFGSEGKLPPPKTIVGGAGSDGDFARHAFRSPGLPLSP